MAVARQKFSTLMDCGGELGVIQVGAVWDGARITPIARVSLRKIRSGHHPFPFSLQLTK